MKNIGNMKILVTGASGFIGSFLVEGGLERGMQVWAGVRQSSSRKYLQDERIRFAELDFTDSDIKKSMTGGIALSTVRV